MTERTDKEWKKFGKLCPYFGVLSDQKYLPENLSTQSLDDFFESGRTHVKETIGWINDEIPGFIPERLLDFGCGTGRLTIPFSSFAEQVVGVDVSEEMLSLARKNSLQFKRTNIDFLSLHELLEEEKEGFDLIFSFIVFQHIEKKRGEEILQRLLGLLNPNGLIIIHLTYHFTKNSRAHNFATFLRKNFSVINRVLNWRLGKPQYFPLMLMTNYDLNRVFKIFQTGKFKILSIKYTDHGGHLGLVIMASNEI